MELQLCRAMTACRVGIELAIGISAGRLDNIRRSRTQIVTSPSNTLYLCKTKDKNSLLNSEEMCRILPINPESYEITPHEENIATAPDRS